MFEFVCVYVCLEIKGGTKFSYKECLKSYGNILTPPPQTHKKEYNFKKKERKKERKKEKWSVRKESTNKRTENTESNCQPILSLLSISLSLSFIPSPSLYLSLHFYHIEKTSAVRL